MNYKCIVSFLLIFSMPNAAISQSFTAKVIDGNTGIGLPYTTIQTGKNQGVVTNEEGYFTVFLDKVTHPQDSVFISSMGYQQIGFVVSQKTDSILLLQPKTLSLGQVFLSSKKLSVDEIIEKVKERVPKNYKMGLSDKQIFYRQSEYDHLKKADFGFQKSSIEEFNRALMDSMADLIPKRSEHFIEVAGNFYGNYSKHKLHIDKAAELYDKSKDVSADGLADKLERIFKENVKPDSYLKIKSGIFGTKVQFDSVMEANAEEAAVIIEKGDTISTDFQEGVKDRISELYEQLFFNDGTKLDILEKSNRYKFSHLDYTFINNEPVYIVNFEPKGGKDFKGIMYVNTQDYAIVRLDFENVKPLKKFGLLGIKYRENVYRGKMLFAKNVSGGYGPKFIEIEQGNFFGLNRPLKVIEKNKNVKGRRKQNELSLELNFQVDNLTKYELVIFNSVALSESAYNDVRENTSVKASYLPAYDPTFWKSHTIMEPNRAIQEFKVVELETEF